MGSFRIETGINITALYDDMKVSQRLLNTLRRADSVAIFTGAGMSAESGVPTFRGAEGLWKKFKPEELADFDSFMRNPDLVWEWYRHRKQILGSVQPHVGHYSIAEMEHFHKQVTVITQNIDNLHRRAGSSMIHELHGNIERNYCVSCGTFFSDNEIDWNAKAPRCSRCSGLIRPDVVWFGELLPVDQWNAGVAAAEQADVFFSIGTSASVFPAASLPITAKRAGAFVVEVNIEPTDLSEKADEVLLGKAGEILSHILTTCYSSVPSHS